MRSFLAALVIVAFVGFTVFAVVVFGWYGFRVVTELGEGSWKTPTEVVDHHGETFVKLYGSEWRVTVPVVLEDLPDHVANAFLAAEDVRFRSHFGIDPLGIGRAALTNVRAGGIEQGGSTITQQLAKTRFLTAERTFSRKALEAAIALLIEVRLTKNEILEAYLNDVYLGHRHGRTVVGLDEAARVYFKKSPNDLTVAEVALLAGMIRAPNRDNPEENREIARKRRDAVLGVMRNRGWLDQEEHDNALKQRVRFRPGSPRPTPHPYYVAALRSELIDRVGERRLRGGGLKIYTAVDPKMQRAAEEAVRAGTQRLRGRHRWLRRKEPLQAAILSVDPSTGGIRALVGGTDYRKSQFDRTRRMRRQPGSALKPFIYAAAIAERTITPASIVVDEPVEIQLARNDVWRPHNYDQRYRGEVTVREAFEKSLNTPAVRIADHVGVRSVRSLLDDVRIEGELSNTPAVALGVDEVTMRELVGAYSIFPNLGRRTEPHLIDRVETGSGRALYRFRQRRRETLDPAVAYLVHSLMRGVVERGTASDLGRRGLGHIAGKTGTTNDYRDAWFVGYSPDLLTASWVGFDDGTALRISSAEAALPIWAAFMAKAPHQRGDLAPPHGVSVVAIEPASGLRWISGCGQRFEEVFLAGTEPEDHCRGWVEEPPLLAVFEEPPVISEETFNQWATETPGPEQVPIVIDPSTRSAPERHDRDDPDVLDREEREAIDRKLREAVRALEEDLRENEPEEEKKDEGEERDQDNPGIFGY